MVIPKYKKQFDKSKRKRIKTLIKEYGKIPLVDYDYKYQTFELQCCLSVGLLLAVLNTASSLLELFIRDLVVINQLKKEKVKILQSSIKMKRGALNKKLGEIEKRIEEDRSMTFSKLIEILEKEKAIKKGDKKELGKFYKYVRIPLSHGLIRRFVVKHDKGSRFIEKLLGTIDRFHNFEEVIEDFALDELEFILKIIRKYQ